MGEENDRPEGRDREDCDQNWVWGDRLVPVEDVVGELCGMCENKRWVKMREREFTRAEAAMQKKGRISRIGGEE